MRNPSSQFSINTLAGKHFPDFIFISNNTISLIEVKERGEFDNEYSNANIKAK